MGVVLGYVVSASVLVVLQTLLIAALLAERVRRRRVEQVLRTNEAALQSSVSRIRHLAGRMITAQEAARSRIARELHDDACQQLASLSLAIGDLTRQRGEIQDWPAQEALSDIRTERSA